MAKGSSTASGERDRLASIDTLRALAIAAVVLFHAHAHLEVDVPVLYASGGLLGVQLFFLVSGYLISDSARRYPLRTYAIRRALRIYPAYVTALLAVTALRGHWPDRDGDWPYFFLNLVGLSHLNAYALLRFDVLGISWTLTVELVWYALAPLLVLTAGRSREPAWALLLAPFAALSVVWVWAAARGWLDAWFVPGFARLGVLPVTAPARFAFVTNQFPAHLVLFVLGAAARTHEARLARWPASMLLAATVLLAGWPDAVDAWIGLHPSLIPGAGMAALFLLGIRDALPRLAAVGWIGRASYPMFLVHVPIMQWVHGPLGLDGPAALGVALVLVAAAAWPLHRLIEEPGIRLGRRLTTPQ